MRRELVTAAILAVGGVAGHPAESRTLLPLTVYPYPLTSIKPTGWLKDELETSASGLAGSLGTFYKYVAHSSWLGGQDEYSDLNEGFPYWFNGLVYLAYGLDDEALKSQVHDAASYVLDHQQEDGWIGPETGDARMLWGRYPLFLGLTGLADANSTWEGPVVSSLYKFTDLMWKLLKEGGKTYLWHPNAPQSADEYTWGRVRAADMMLTMQWLFENHPGSKKQQSQAWECMEMLYDGSLKWEAWYNEAAYIKKDLYRVSSDKTEANYPYEHGVNVGQGLKAVAVVNRFTHNNSLLDTATSAVDWTFRYHGAASGTVLADERIDGLSPYTGSELCTAVETIYSLTYLYQSVGNRTNADRAELAAFNALPAMLTGDHWAHQYMEQPNQPYSKNLSATPFYNSNSWAQTFGLEPNYPCCTVNHPQGQGKFLANSWARRGTVGVSHILLSPSKITTKVENKTVEVECTTEYPFGDTLEYSINADGPFELFLRVPTWFDPGSSSIKVGHKPTSILVPDPYNGLHSVFIPKGKTHVKYVLGSKPQVSPRANDTVAITKGALLYALEFSYTNSSTLPKDYSTLEEFGPHYAPAQSRDWTIVNTSPWNYAIDPSTLVFHASNEPLGSPAFAPGSAKSYMTVMACQIKWPLFLGSVPGAAPPKKSRKCLKKPTKVKLVPYGGTKLHMAELPTIDLKGM